MLNKLSHSDCWLIRNILCQIMTQMSIILWLKSVSHLIPKITSYKHVLMQQIWSFGIFMWILKWTFGKYEDFFSQEIINKWFPQKWVPGSETTTTISWVIGEWRRNPFPGWCWIITRGVFSGLPDEAGSEPSSSVAVVPPRVPASGVSRLSAVGVSDQLSSSRWFPQPLLIPVGNSSAPAPAGECLVALWPGQTRIQVHIPGGLFSNVIKVVEIQSGQSVSLLVFALGTTGWIVLFHFLTGAFDLWPRTSFVAARWRVSRAVAGLWSLWLSGSGAHRLKRREGTVSAFKGASPGAVRRSEGPQSASTFPQCSAGGSRFGLATRNADREPVLLSRNRWNDLSQQHGWCLSQRKPLNISLYMFWI